MHFFFFSDLTNYSSLSSSCIANLFGIEKKAEQYHLIIFGHRCGRTLLQKLLPVAPSYIYWLQKESQSSRVTSPWSQARSSCKGRKSDIWCHLVCLWNDLNNIHCCLQSFRLALLQGWCNFECLWDTTLVPENAAQKLGFNIISPVNYFLNFLVSCKQDLKREIRRNNFGQAPQKGSAECGSTCWCP